MNIRPMTEVWEAANFSSRLIMPPGARDRIWDQKVRDELDAMATQLVERHIKTVQERFGFALVENDMEYLELYDQARFAHVMHVHWDATRRSAKILNGPEQGKYIGFEKGSVRNTVRATNRMLPVWDSSDSQTFEMVNQSHTFELLGWSDDEGGFVAKDVSAELPESALILDEH